MNDNTQGPEPDSRQSRLIEDVVSLLLAMAQRLQQHAVASAAEFDMTLSQAKVLVELEPGEAVPMGELALRLNYDASNLTGLVDRLEARGALERRLDPDDRRVKEIVITNEGARLQDAFRRRLLDHRGSFGALTVAQLQELRDLLSVALEKE
ncbi:MAG: MarR family winged helix-turn-helix transcriptional regulator [Chloroflexota bacterium]